MLTAADLKCEYQTNPRDVDTRHPRFAWVLAHPERGQAQTAFQIVAASNPAWLTPGAADLWDTGKIRSPHAMAGYSGYPLAPGDRCYWAVRAWDAHDRPGPFSPPACFELGRPAPAGRRAAAPPAEPAAQFWCSSDRLNRLHHQAAQIESRCLAELAAGTPEADPGSLTVRAETLLYNFDAGRSLAGWLAADLADRNPASTLSLKGLLAGAAAFRVAWQLFMLRGDARPMADHYAGLKQRVEFLSAHATDGLLTGAAGPDPAGLPDGFTATALYYDAVLMVYEIAGVLGHAADKEAYAQRFDAVAAAFNRRFLDETAGGYGGPTAGALALYLELVPPERRARTAESLARALAAQPVQTLPADGLSVKALLEGLTRAGQAEPALSLIEQLAGPTGDGAAIDSPTLAAIDAWLIKTIGGVSADTDPDYPAFERFFVCPRPVSGVTEARLALNTVRGPLRAAWQTGSDGAFNLDVGVPVGSQAVITLPCPLPGQALSEGQTLIWPRPAADLPAGIHSVEASGEALRVTAGSGDYTFRCSAG